MSRIRVLFVCSGNHCLSPIAEGCLKRYGGDHFEVLSAGLSPRPLDPLAVDSLQRAGIDISGHRPTPVSEYEGTEFDFVISLGEDVRDEGFHLGGGARLIHWRFSEPGAADATPAVLRKRYQRVRDEVASRVRLFAYAQSRRFATRPVSLPMAG
jgi:arsenate reductase